MRSLIKNLREQKCSRCQKPVPRNRITWTGISFCHYWCEYWTYGRASLSREEAEEIEKRRPGFFRSY